MTDTQHSKVTADHLRRNAYLYIRQSTIKQVFENTESTKRQYALKDRAIALGWSLETIVVIDNDLGQSGASAEHRAGFKQLVSAVSLDQAGIVMGLEVSRLARNSSDWHRLLEICAMTDTLICDEDGVYDPSNFNDRLILGLKGTMSEAELHLLKSRLQGGILSKAKRGELESRLPVGLTYNVKRAVILDPDRQVQDSLKTFFSTFERTGSATATVKYFQQNNLKFPRKIAGGHYKGEFAWSDLTHWKALEILHNPRYAGAFCYGRGKTKKLPSGKGSYKVVPIDEWTVLHKEAHVGYITWQQYEKNVKRLEENSQAHGHDRRRSPPREGPALLQGLMICGRCGNRMTVRYTQKKGYQTPNYVCQREGIANARQICQCLPGGSIDQAVSQLILDSVTPLMIDVALQIQNELELRSNEVMQLQKKHIERARYEADLARARFMKVDPRNRLVADTLEAEWNGKLTELEAMQTQFEQDHAHEQVRLTEQKRQELLRMATDFPALWNGANTPNKEKKRIVRLIIEDVTLTRTEGIQVAVRFRGGATEMLSLPAPQPIWAIRKTDAATIRRIDELLDTHSAEEVAERLNQEGYVTGMGQSFTRLAVHHLRMQHRLKSRRARMIEQGYLTVTELARQLDVVPTAISRWARTGVMDSCTDGKDRLYKMPDKKLVDRLRALKKPGRKNTFMDKLAQKLNEVHCAT